MPHVPLLVESPLKAKTKGSGSKVSLLSKMVRSVLHDRLLRMQPSASRCNDVGGVLCALGLGSTEELRDGIDDA